MYLSLARILTLLVALLQPGAGSPAYAASPEIPVLSAEQLRWLGERIFQNECNGKKQCLTAWNEGEEFPSLGIGHFIWYRAGQQAPFQQTFPALLMYLQQQGIQLPLWLQQQPSQPWPDRSSFLAASQQQSMIELRELLANTQSEQTAFIISRFSKLATDINTPMVGNSQLRQHLLAVANSKIPYGLYALIDYVHFKGDGTLESERYQGQGWGLQQVLAGMDNNSDPLLGFVKSAQTTLQRRVSNAPPERHEERWLKGWQNRVQTYLPPSTQP